MMRALGHEALRARRPRPRRPRRAPPGVDHPDAVERVAVLDILPTRDDVRAHRPGVRHRVLPLVLPDPARRPARAADRRRPGYYLRAQARRLGVERGLGLLRPARARRVRALLRDPATIHATCEDYRAAATIDLDHDAADVAAGRRVACPLLVLWGDKGVVHRLFDAARRLARGRRRRARPRAAVRPLSSPRKRRTRRSRSSTDSLPPDVPPPEAVRRGLL